MLAAERKVRTSYDGSQRYIADVIAFDSETQTVYDERGRSHTGPVSFQLAINDSVLIVRTVDEIIEVFNRLCTEYATQNVMTSGGKYVKYRGELAVIYVHNLEYDMTFLFDRIIEYVDREFTIKNRIVKFQYKYGIEFRDSFILTNMSLDKSIKEYADPARRINKTTGWEYDGRVRSPLTKLTRTEIEYAAIDALGLVEVIRGLCKLHRLSVADLPITATGFTRRRLIAATAGKTHRAKTVQQKAYRDLIATLTLTPGLYQLTRECFKGGIAEINPRFADVMVHGVDDYDIGSAYPAAMILERFPMSTPKWVGNVTQQQLDELADDPEFGFMVQLEVSGLRVKPGSVVPPMLNTYRTGDYDEENEKVIKINQRVYSAEKVIVHYNEIDYRIFRELYDYDKVEVLVCAVHRMDYLPTEIREFLLTGYENKTRYKDVKGKETPYALSKIALNSIYGIMVQNPAIEQYEMSRETGETFKVLTDEDPLDKALRYYNKAPNRAAYYLWGAYVASYGHEYLYDAIFGVGEDLVVCDTDSVKFVNRDGKHDELFRRLNLKMAHKIKKISELFDIPLDRFGPSTSSGEKKWLGMWENQEKPGRKLLGLMPKRSKFYARKFEHQDGQISYELTTAGVSGQRVQDSLREQVAAGKYETFEDAFADDFVIPAGQSGKLAHKYDRRQKEITYTDDDGNEWTFTNRFAVHLEPTAFTYETVSEDAADIIEMIQNRTVTMV